MMDKFSNEQRSALLNKIIDNYDKFSYREDKDGRIILNDADSQITVFPQSDNYYPIIFEHSEIYVEDNNDLWRNLPETLRARKINLDERIKLETQIEDENRSQEKLNNYLGL